MSAYSQIIIEEKIGEIRETILAVARKMVVPLFLVFWICDLLYMPDQKWAFLALRFAIIPIQIWAIWFLKKLDRSYREIQIFAIFYVGLTASLLTAMIFLSGDWASPYYAGLNLVALGGLAFIPFSQRYFAAAVVATFGPYFLLALVLPVDHKKLSEVAVNLFFVVGTIVVTSIIRRYQEEIRIKEVTSRLRLADEVLNRDAIIEAKSAETIKLAALSSQFSPQVVDAIRSGKIELNRGVRRVQICAIFIDIVNSTERVLRLDKDKVNRALTMFMEDSSRILLKYDITIDKFLGDGVLAFCNDPIAYDDYRERVVLAALEIRERIKAKEDLYLDCWMNELQLKIGIASGFANVGFYGNDRYYRSYTAIGPVMNLASRLCSVADPNQILISGDVAEELPKSEFVLKPAGRRSLKGFEADIIKVYDVSTLRNHSGQIDEIDCPSCKSGLLYLDADASGIFIMKCRSCGFVQKDALTTSLKAKPNPSKPQAS